MAKQKFSPLYVPAIIFGKVQPKPHHTVGHATRTECYYQTPACMNRSLYALIIAFAFGLLPLSLQAQQWQSDTLRPADLHPMTGSWVATEWNSVSTSTTQLNLDIDQPGRSPRYIWRYSETPDRIRQRRDTLLLAKNGRTLSGAPVTAVRGNGATTDIQTELIQTSGTDTIILRTTYRIQPDSFEIRKEIRFGTNSEWKVQSIIRSVTRIRILTTAQMKHDIDIVRAVWERVHPGLYRYNTKRDIDRHFARIERAALRPMEQRYFYVLMQQLNCALRCGHSFVSYYNTRMATKGNLYSRVYLPLLFRMVGRTMVVSHPLSDDPRITEGSVILTLDGIPVRTVIDSLLTVSKCDGRNGLNKQLDNITLNPNNIVPERYSLFDIYYPLFFKKDINAPDYNITLKHPDGTIHTIRCKGLSKEQRYNRYVERYGALQRNEETWYMKELTPTTALFRLGDFTTYNWKFDFRRYLDSVFGTIRAKGYRNLIVDIRNNEGGADDARDAVLGYLTSKDIGCANPVRLLYRYRSIPDSLLPYLDTWDDSFKKPKTEADYAQTTDGFIEPRDTTPTCTSIAIQDKRFTGTFFLITDATNSSATFIMADAVKRNKLGTLVGETTGGTQQGINGGELFFLYLPNSLFEMDVPLIYQCPRSPRPDTGITPDITVATTVADIIARRDPQVERILRLLR
ncbi:MAG: hypothetical protein JNL32_10895 [Candidatus Kapabacteria bacterium]|nr:hypothetical protein [Candidatus Kapabacteria bacterium]